MKLFFAPLEGITNYIYRNTHAKVFGGCDCYYAPFIVPSDNEKINLKGLKDVLTENNTSKIKVQILTKDSQAFLKFAAKIKAAGYDELNLNLGCPYPTVVRKGRGAGFLTDPEGLDKFLYEIFEKADIKISVKTRVGYASANELDNLMQIYNKYPISLLTIHPRTREDFYNGMPNLEAFTRAYAISKNELCYNGDIFSKEDFVKITEMFPRVNSFMLGRGAMANPALFREIKDGKKLTTAELIYFTEKLTENYRQTLRSDVFTMHKLKEIWCYIIKNYPEEKKIAKAIKKAGKLSDFMIAIKSLPERI